MKKIILLVGSTLLSMPITAKQLPEIQQASNRLSECFDRQMELKAQQSQKTSFEQILANCKSEQQTFKRWLPPEVYASAMANARVEIEKKLKSQQLDIDE